VGHDNNNDDVDDVFTAQNKLLSNAHGSSNKHVFPPTSKSLQRDRNTAQTAQ